MTTVDISSELKSLGAYELLQVKELPEYDGIGYVLRHKNSKARVMVICNEDNNKVFDIGFRTPPSDDTGVAHITEHSVLCGSKKFPVKDPFVELCKGSLNTFLNAMTYSDKTVYPVASLNHKDFHNLMHVYLDAVFYPNIYTKDEIMQQEGWHYEFDEESGELKLNGVVFNEMKGVYSDPEQLLYRGIESSLYPDTPYFYESGGDPVHIPELTMEAFRDFHSRYYHPSNSYIYLYGDMDAVSELKFIDEEYLSKFEYLAIDSSIADQKPFEKPVSKEFYYSISDSDDVKENTYLSYNVSVGKSTDMLLCTAFSVLDSVLVSTPGAPLKVALVDKNIGKDIFSSYDPGINQPVFSIIAKNSDPEKESEFINTINDTLSSIVANGINKKSLLAAINSFEFSHKEGTNSRFSKGLIDGLNAYSTWLYDDDEALTVFSMNDIYKKLREYADTDYFEKLIETYILSNNHKAYVRYCPKKGLGEQMAEEEKNKLADYKATLSETELEDIKNNEKHLKEYQSSEDSQEDLMKIPMLEISDIDKEARKVKNNISEIAGVKTISHDVFANGISYVQLLFDMKNVSFEKLPAASLLCEIFKYVDTEHFTYNDLADEINLYLGGIGFNTSVMNKKEYGKYYLNFVVKFKMFDNYIDKGFELVNEILFTSKIDDKKRLREIIAETRSNLKNSMVSSGHITAAGRALSYISELSKVKELTEGLDYYNYVSLLDDDFDNQYEKLVVDLKNALNDIFRKDTLLVSYTGKTVPDESIKDGLASLTEKLSTEKTTGDKGECKLEINNEAISTASQVQYVATAGNFRANGLGYNGALSVLTTIFSYEYLWLNVRVKGGAYGCMCSFNRSGNAYFTSYRDPNLEETYEIYKKAAEFVKTFNCEERDMRKYIIGAISKLDAPLTPASEGAFNTICYIGGITDEDLQRERNEVLTADVSAIRNLEPYVQSIIDTDIICVIGNEKKIEDSRSKFKKLLTM